MYVIFEDGCDRNHKNESCEGCRAVEVNAHLPSERRLKLETKDSKQQAVEAAIARYEAATGKMSENMIDTRISTGSKITLTPHSPLPVTQAKLNKPQPVQPVTLTNNTQLPQNVPQSTTIRSPPGQSVKQKTSGGRILLPARLLSQLRSSQLQPGSSLNTAKQGQPIMMTLRKADGTTQQMSLDPDQLRKGGLRNLIQKISKPAQHIQTVQTGAITPSGNGLITAKPFLSYLLPSFLSRDRNRCDSDVINYYYFASPHEFSDWCICDFMTLNIKM